MYLLSCLLSSFLSCFLDLFIAFYLSIKKQARKQRKKARKNLTQILSGQHLLNVESVLLDHFCIVSDHFCFNTPNVSPAADSYNWALSLGENFNIQKRRGEFNIQKLLFFSFLHSLKPPHPPDLVTDWMRGETSPALQACPRHCRGSRIRR